MNIQDPALTDPTVQSSSDDSTTDSTSTKGQAKDKDSKSFSKVLAEKSDKSKTAPDTKSDARPDAALTAQPQAFRDPAPVAQQARHIAPAALPPAMQNLVQEISVATGPQNRAQVDIQLNSKTFDGLKISITHTDGNVAIQMLSRTPEVAAVLNRHLDQLSQALEARGVTVQSIQVQTVTARANARSGTQSGQGNASGQSNPSGQSNRPGRPS